MISGRKSQAGFTLTEILVVLGIFGVILAFTMPITISYYKSYLFRAERDNLVSILQKARGLSLANMNQSQHGVHLDSTGYTLFEGSGFVSGAPKNILFAAGSGITNSGATNVIFDQLTANTSGGNITLHDGIHPDIIISINNEGRIDY